MATEILDTDGIIPQGNTSRLPPSGSIKELKRAVEALKQEDKNWSKKGRDNIEECTRPLLTSIYQGAHFSLIAYGKEVGWSPQHVQIEESERSFKALKDLKKAMKKLEETDKKCKNAQKKSKISKTDWKGKRLSSIKEVFICLNDYGKKIGCSLPSSSLEEENESLKKELYQQRDENQRIDSDYARLNEELGRQRDENKRIESDYARLLEEHEKTMKAQNLELINTQKRATELNEENNTLKNDLQKKELEITRSSEELKTLESKLQKMESENSRLQCNQIESEKTMNAMVNESEANVKKYEADLRVIESKLQKAYEENGYNVQTIQTLSQEREFLRKELQKTQEEKKWIIRRNEETESNLRTSIDNLRGTVTAERKAKEDALTRLSAAAASKLRDKNPGITDLSDPNRPLKLAEKISELYDNEWTNAMEKLEEEDVAEEQGIALLLKIFTTLFTTFSQLGDQQLHDFAKVVIFPMPILTDNSTNDEIKDPPPLPTEIVKPMKDFRKMNALLVVPILEKVALQVLKNENIPDNYLDACTEYVKCCSEISWLMRVQDPPVHMRWSFEKGEVFDTNIMRSYTKSGKFVDYVVWPVLYLHQNGPLLAKGVMQGSKVKAEVKKQTENHVEDKAQNKNLKMNGNKNEEENVEKPKEGAMITGTSGKDEKKKIECHDQEELKKKSELDTPATEVNINGTIEEEKEKSVVYLYMRHKNDPNTSEANSESDVFAKGVMQEAKGKVKKQMENNEDLRTRNINEEENVEKIKEEAVTATNGMDEKNKIENHDKEVKKSELDTAAIETNLNGTMDEGKKKSKHKVNPDASAEKNSESDEGDYLDATDQIKIGIQETGDGDNSHPYNEKSEQATKYQHDDVNSEPENHEYEDASENAYGNNEPNPSAEVIDKYHAYNSKTDQTNVLNVKGGTDDLQLD